MSSRVAYIERTRELYAPIPAYRWADLRGVEVPWQPLAKPLSRCRVAVASSGGVHASDQPAFHFKDDTSVRILPSDIAAADLRISHFGYPTADAIADANCVFPIERLRELAEAGVIGSLADTSAGFMGGIYSQRRVHDELIPAVIEWLGREAVDLFYLVPA